MGVSTNYENKCSQKQPPGLLYIKKVFLKTLKNSNKDTCARVSFLIKLQASDLY